MVSAGIYQVTKEEHENHPRKKRDYEGVIKLRWTTDILFAVLIWLMWAGMSYVGYTGLKTGNPYRLTAPIDAEGNSCGYEGPEYKTNTHFYTVMTYGLGSCVPGCPTQDAVLTSTDPNDYYCLESLVPSDSTARQAYISTTCMVNGLYSITSGCFCNIKRKTVSIFYRCKFVDTAVRTKYVTQSAPPYFQGFIADINTARDVIFGFGFGFAIFLSFVWAFLLELKWLGYIVVWTGLATTQIVMIILCYLAQSTAIRWSHEDPEVHTENETLALKVFAGILLAAAVLFFIGVLMLCSQINLSIKLVALAAKCVSDMKFLVFTPFINLIAFAIFMVPCVIYMFYVASDGSFDIVSVKGIHVGVQYKPAPGVVDRLWFLFFCLLWTMNFIGSISDISIAIACSKWYFTENRRQRPLRSWAAIRSFGKAIRFHWGTAAFGSLLIAIVQFVRWYLLWLQKTYKKIPGTKSIVKMVCCCVQCCLWCLECCIKFIDKHAYIQTAIHGTGFMTSCKDAFYAISRNIFRVGAVKVVGGLAVFSGKISILATVVAASYYYFEVSYQGKLNGFVGPLVLIGVITWFTTSMFMDVYHISLETIFMCFIDDEETHGGNAKYMDAEFKKFVDDHCGITPGEHGTDAAEQPPLEAAAVAV